MTPLRQRMIEDLQLRGLAPRTQESYVREVRQLAQHYGKSPDLLTEEDLRQYFLYLRNEKHAARNTCTVALCAIKFFYEQTLQRHWPILELVRPPQEYKLPVVLSPEEVWHVLGQIRLPHYRVCLSIIYACGLRLREGRRSVAVRLCTEMEISVEVWAILCLGRVSEQRRQVNEYPPASLNVARAAGVSPARANSATYAARAHGAPHRRGRPS